MKTAAKFIFVVVIVIMLLFLFGEQLGYTIPGRKKVDQDTRIVVIYKSINTGYEFWDVVKDGIAVAANEFGVLVKVVGPSSKSEEDVEAQIEILEQTIAEKPDAIVLVATDYNRMVEPVEKAKEEGIKIITMDSGINSDVSECFIATDNIEAGRKAADELVKLLDEDAVVAIIGHVQGTKTAIDREKGVREGLARHNIKKIYGPYFSDGLSEKASRITKELISQKPEIKGIVGLNEGSTVGVARALKEMGLSGKIKLVGFDNSFDEIKLIEEGVIQATVVQNPFNMGYRAIEMAVKSLKGEKIEKWINTGSVAVTKENMYSNENQRLLFPFIDK
ncbi:MAG TPA: ABC transporter substrate-binding protein [Clostridiaceae bacterium]|nr:ABC transporter substrate-binding protein [Clostridiaceae bacterium]